MKASLLPAALRYPGLLRFGLVILALGLSSAPALARPGLQRLEARTRAVTDVRWRATEVKNVHLMSRTRPAAIRRLTADLLAYASTHPDDESTSAVPFLIASTRFAFADLLENVPTPTELLADPVLAAEYRVQIAGYASPLRAQGRKYLEVLLARTRSQNLVNTWTVRAEALLAANPAPVAAAAHHLDSPSAN